jgi:hypothetical protein
VPYAKLGDPQSLNLYAYVDGDPTNHADPDGHACFDPKNGCNTSGSTPSKTPGNPGDKKVVVQLPQPSKLSQYAKGALKVVGGIAAVGVVATNPEIGVVGGLVGGLGGSASFVSGTTQIVGTATHTDTTQGTEAVDAYGSPQGLVVGAATGGNSSLAQVATTSGDVAGLVSKPESAVGVVEKITTAVDLATGGVKSGFDTVRNMVSPPSPPTPAAPGLPSNWSQMQ